MLDPHRPQSLRGRRILVVEDDYLIADDLCDTLEAQGATVLGPVPSLVQAFALLEARGQPDGAILDINLGGVMVYPLADALLARGVPILFATGYDLPALPPAYADVPHCEKPVDMSECIKALIR